MKLSPKEHNLDDAFRERLKDFEVPPSELAWFGIEANLPARNVLANPFRIAAGIAGTLAAVCFGVLAMIDSNTDRRAVAAHRSELKMLEMKATAVAGSQDIQPSQPTPPIAILFDPIVTVTRLSSGTVEPVENLEPINLSTASANEIPSDLSVPSTDVAVDLKPFDEGAVKGLRIGGIFGVNNTWLFAGTQVGDNIATGYKPTLGPAVGFSIGYDFSSRSGVEVNVIGSSSEGQTYEVMTESGPTSGTASINYLRIPVLYKQRFARQSNLLNTPVSLNYLAGLQYGRLNWVNVDREIGFIGEEDFNRQELGIILGLEYDIYFAKNYLLSFGARAAVNNDLSAFPFFMSDEYAETANFAVGFNVKLSYQFKLGS